MPSPWSSITAKYPSPIWLKGIGARIKPFGVIAGIGADAGGFAFCGRAVVVGRDQPAGPLPRT